MQLPHASVCLLSALSIHELTTEVPGAVWIMIDRSGRMPRLTYPKIHVVRASVMARSQGLEQRVIGGVRVSLTTPAKTVADCFRYRRHVGLDVALEALRDYLHGIDHLSWLPLSSTPRAPRQHAPRKDLSGPAALADGVQARRSRLLRRE